MPADKLGTLQCRIWWKLRLARAMEVEGIAELLYQIVKHPDSEIS